MSELSHRVPDLDIRLTEIDRRLREIQAELVPEREPRPTRPAAPAPTPQPQTPPPRRGRAGPLASILQRSPRTSPAAGPEATAPAGEAAPVNEPTAPADQIAALTRVHAQLLQAMRDLLGAYEWVLAQMPAPAAEADARSSEELTLSVGPFANTEAVRAFERVLDGVPGVSQVTLRGYEGENRALFDVQLSA